MKAAIVASVLLSLSGTVSAANYFAECTSSSCLPFTTSNSYVLQFAADTAASATYGDEIYIYKSVACGEKWMTWTVIDVPVLNSTDLQLDEVYCLTDD